ncbi:MAG: restriction endonuclease subunit S [Petrimonas sp.]|uniref:restriction endonuclease subunit S n=1 Tax=Petrimonas sp. TaxID=2023866 RepID=UPI002B3A94AA|nr:restriction endonuclease subunit S [Petrimonas sp.]
MSRYEAYKPSGIDWIGNVPEHWETVRIKNVASIVNGSTPSSSVEEYWDGDIIWATPGDFNKYEKIIDDSESKITEAGYKSCGTSLVPVGSVVITTRAPIGNVLIAGKELCTNQGCKTLVPNRIESRFLYYIISISSIELNVLGQGTTFLELSKESLGTFKLPLPDFEDQLAIANYLDHQTQKIDCLIANKKAQAEKLKELRQIEINNAVTKGLNPNAEMKDSGIEWLGKIPKHWDTKRIKQVANIETGNTPPMSDPENYSEEGLLWIKPDNLNDFEPLTESAEYLSEKGAKLARIVRRGAILVCCIGTVGKIGVAGKVLSTNQQINSIEFFNSIISDQYGKYLLYSMDKVHNYFSNKVVVAILNKINQGNIKLPIPPKKEQIEIANYLHQRTTAIDQLIKNIEAQIEKLQELRKIKIYEAVTGKIKVNRYE